MNVFFCYSLRHAQCLNSKNEVISKNMSVFATTWNIIHTKHYALDIRSIEVILFDLQDAQAIPKPKPLKTVERKI